MNKPNPKHRGSHPVDTTDDKQMVALGLRLPPLRVDRKCFVKTKEEKEALKYFKSICDA